MQVPGIEAYTVHHLPSGNFRVVAAKADEAGVGWTAHVCDFDAKPGPDDIANVPEVGKQITVEEASIAFSHQNGLWQMLNDHLGQYLEPTKD
jgi:hypothetical protein